MQHPKTNKRQFEEWRQSGIAAYRDCYLWKAAHKAVADKNADRALRILTKLCEDPAVGDGPEVFLDWLWWHRLPKMPAKKAIEAWRRKEKLNVVQMRA